MKKMITIGLIFIFLMSSFVVSNASSQMTDSLNDEYTITLTVDYIKEVDPIDVNFWGNIELPEWYYKITVLNALLEEEYARYFYNRLDCPFQLFFNYNLDRIMDL